MCQQIRGRVGHLDFPIVQNNTNLLEDVDILLLVKFYYIAPKIGRRSVGDWSSTERGTAIGLAGTCLRQNWSQLEFWTCSKTFQRLIWSQQGPWPVVYFFANSTGLIGTLLWPLRSVELVVRQEIAKGLQLNCDWGLRCLCTDCYGLSVLVSCWFSVS